MQANGPAIGSGVKKLPGEPVPLERLREGDAGRKAKSVTTSRFTGQVVPQSGKQLTFIVTVKLSCDLNVLDQIKLRLVFMQIELCNNPKTYIASFEGND